MFLFGDGLGWWSCLLLLPTLLTATNLSTVVWLSIEYCNPILGSFLPCLGTLVLLFCLVVVLVWTKYGKFQKKLKISTFQLFLHFSGLSQPYFRLLWSFRALVVLTIPKICVVVRFVARVTMLWRCVVVCCCWFVDSDPLVLASRDDVVPRHSPPCLIPINKWWIGWSVTPCWSSQWRSPANAMTRSDELCCCLLLLRLSLQTDARDRYETLLVFPLHYNQPVKPDPVVFVVFLTCYWLVFTFGDPRRWRFVCCCLF